MRRGVRGWAARRDREPCGISSQAAFWVICSTTSEERSRSFKRASVRSAAKARPAASRFEGAGAEADSGGFGDSIGFFVSEFMAWPERKASLSTARFRGKSSGQECPPYTCRYRVSALRDVVARHAQRSFDWLHDLRIHLDSRIRAAKFIVKNLAHRRCMTKDTSSHGHRDGSGLLLAEQAADYDRATEASSLPALERTCEARSSLLATITGNRAAKSGGGIELAARARSTSDVTPQAFRRAEESSDCRVVPEIHRLIGGTQNGADGCAANPVGGAFVSDGESPASGAGRFSLTVSAVGDRSGAGDDDDSGAGVECGFERNLHVAHYVDRCRDNLGEGAANNSANSGRAAPEPPTQVREIFSGVMPAAAQAWRTDCCNDSRPGTLRRERCCWGRRWRLQELRYRRPLRRWFWFLRHRCRDSRARVSSNTERCRLAAASCRLLVSGDEDYRDSLAERGLLP